MGTSPEYNPTYAELGQELRRAQQEYKQEEENIRKAERKIDMLSKAIRNIQSEIVSKALEEANGPDRGE